MIYLYGDSHSKYSFTNLNLPHINNYCFNITMFRIGRDNNIINFNNDDHDKNSIICMSYGEIDCRCHIQQQINLNFNEDDIIQNLIEKYFKTIKNNINKHFKIIIIGIIPPTSKICYENKNGPITHEYPFIGSDEDRVRFTNKMNNLIQEYCDNNNFIYFNPYSYYTRENGTLKYELSDSSVHLGDTTYFLNQFYNLINSFKN